MDQLNQSPDLDAAQMFMDPAMLAGYGVELPIEDPLPDVDFLEMARSARSSSASWFDTNVRSSMQSSMNQFHGKHDAGSRYLSDMYRTKSKLYIPKTRSNIRKHEATCAQAYFSTQDVVEINAFNDSDINAKAAADFYKELLNLRLTSSGPNSIPWFQLVLGAYQNAMNLGVAISFQGWDDARKKPKSELIPPENFRFDPACDWLNPILSSPFLIWEQGMRVGEIKKKIKAGTFQQVSNDQLAAAGRPGVDAVNQARNAGRTDPNSRSNTITDFDLVMVQLNIIEYEGVDWVFWTLGNDTYLSMPTPIEHVWLHGERPFVLGVCVIETHKNYPTSIPGLTRDMQAYQNNLVNQRLDNARLAMDKRYLVRAGARVDVDSIVRNAPGSTTLVTDVEKDVKVVSTPDVNPSAYKEQSLLDIAMDDLTGGFNSGTMQSNRSLNETVGGMTLISQSANQVAEYQLKTFNETWVEPVLRQLLLIEQHYEADDAIIAVAGANAQLVKNYGNVSYQDMQFKDLMLTVQVGMGATNPATRLEKFTMGMTALANLAPAIQSMGLDQKEVSKEIFGALGYKDGSRFFQEGVDPQVQQLQAQIQQLTQELSQKRNPAVDAATTEQIKANAYKIRSEANFAAVQTAMVIAQAPALGPIADRIAQVNGFHNVGGEDPDFGINGETDLSSSLNNIASQDPNALALAHQQASMHKLRSNTNPLQPATGMEGENSGIEGGQQ